MKLSAQSSGQRVEKFIADECPDLSRAKARKMCEEGAVLVNGRKVKPGKILKAGDEISFEVAEQVRPRPELVLSQGGALNFLDVLYEDDFFWAINKPREMHSVTLSFSDPITLADCLAELDSKTVSASKDSRESGLVQRLDYYTGGVVLAAKTPEAWTVLHQLMLEGGVRKTYLAVVEGKPEKEKTAISLPLVQKKDDMVAVSKTGKEKKVFYAETYVQTLKSFGEVSLVRVQAERVFRHQVRVHLSAIGCPLLGDEKYGAAKNFSSYSFFVEQGFGIEGFFLHAESVEFKHPWTGEDVRVESDKAFAREMKVLFGLR